MFQITTANRKYISKYRAGFVECDAMLAFIGKRFFWIPIKFHGNRTKFALSGIGGRSANAWMKIIPIS